MTFTHGDRLHSATALQIGANSDDAQENIKRFRTVLSKDLSDIAGEFQDWSKEVLGSLATPQGMMIAGAAAMGASLLALGAIASETANKFAEYVDKVDSGSDRTGIAADKMSVLKFAADRTGTSFDALVMGINRLQTSVAAANGGNDQAIQKFERLGISAATLKKGEEDVVPVLEAVMDKLRGLKSGTEQVAIARDQFGKNGTELLEFLRMGSEGMATMAQRAHELGLVITEEDIVAVKQYKVAQAELKAVQDAADVEVGRRTLPLVETVRIAWAGLFATIKGGTGDFATFATRWGANMDVIADRIHKTVAGLMAEGDEKLKGGAFGGPTDLQNWYGLSSILEGVKGKIAEATSEDASSRRRWIARNPRCRRRGKNSPSCGMKAS